MSDKNERAILVGNRALCCGDVIGQRREWILHGCYMQTLGLKQGNNFGVAEAVGKGAVHQHHILYG